MASTFHIVTFGCQMNKNDSERIAGLLSSCGMEESNDENTADVVIMNTCSVRQTAEDRIYGLMAGIRDRKIKNPKLIVCITGCMAGRDRDGKIRAKLPLVDLFFPTDELVHLPKRLAEISPFLFVDDQNADYEHYLKITPAHTSKKQAFITISTGCNKFCTYCVVPYSRGLQKDRNLADILKEVRDLAAQGCIEITLLGQTVNWYRPQDKESFHPENPLNTNRGNYFGALLWELNQIEGIERIHWTAPHPIHMTPEVIEALKLPKQVNYLHLPVQAGNNEVLKRMNRPYTREFYLDLINKIRAARPEIALGTDIIVGFAGESEEAFQDTVSMYKEADFDISYTAMYSTRSHTKAAETLKDDVSYKEKKIRWHELQRLMEETVHRKNQAYVNTTVQVMVDSYDNGTCSGNSNEMKRVQFRGDETMKGTIVPVVIDRALEWMLYGHTA